jgi:post-segregation antitoxin (ccd killing protein)
MTIVQVQTIDQTGRADLVHVARALGITISRNSPDRSLRVAIQNALRTKPVRTWS